MGLAGNRGQHDLRRRDGEIVAVVLADSEEIHPHLIGQHAFVDHIADHLGL